MENYFSRSSRKKLSIFENENSRHAHHQHDDDVMMENLHEIEFVNRIWLQEVGRGVVTNRLLLTMMIMIMIMIKMIIMIK